MITKEKRAKMEKLIYDVKTAIDPTGRNTKKYKELFKNMSDKEFDNFFKELFSNEERYLTLDISDYEIDLTMDNIEKAADVLNIPLFEYVATPYYTMDKNNIVVTREKVPVGYCHIKRQEQSVILKNGMSTSISTRNALTQQVTNQDKNGKESDLENFAMVSLGLTNIMKELNGPRADDIKMKQDMLTKISTDGFVSMAELESDPYNKSTLNTVDVFLLGMGIKSDLVTKGLMLKKTLKEEI